MHPYVHSSTIHSIQDRKATQMSTDRWMDKEDVVHTYSGLLLSHKKEWNDAIFSNIEDLEIIILGEVSQKEKDKYHMISLVCGI